ncbi:MAG: SIMPL domain-containing protein, partial [Actinomycetales bacterium]
MSLLITVRGSAERSCPAERGIVSLGAHVEGPEKEEVVARATRALDPLV